MHTSFLLTSRTGSVALTRLFNGKPQVLDFIDYLGLTPDRSYGDFPDGQPFTRQEFSYVTAGGTNNAALLPIQVFINEWMSANTATLADPADGKFDDWFELYNAGPNDADLAGYYLANNTTNKFLYQIPTGYLLAPGGFLLVWADKEPNQNSAGSPDLHANFRLPKSGASIGLYTPDGATVDSVTYSAQASDVSSGRYPDGAGQIYLLSTPTPRGPNSLPGNQPPVLAAITNRTIFLGQTLSFTASATDPDAGQILTYSLSPGFPSGAAINAMTGFFQWTPNALQAPSTSQMTINVADNGSPSLTDSKSFTVVVALRPGATISQTAGTASLSFPVIAGKTYQVKYSGDLNLPPAQWADLVPSFTASADGTKTVNDSTAAQHQRFYLILVE